jgi:membrane associated rhomboid family serine protease
MFPLRDTVRTKRFPIVNLSLIILNVLVFLLQMALGRRGFDGLMSSLALVPATISIENPNSLVTLVSSMFLHGGWVHLISNMWTLFIFGDNVEDRMGSLRYLVFYLIAGVVASLVHVFFGFGSQIPTIGASGAIAGVLGAYFVLFPRGRVVTLIPIFILPWLIEIPAFVFLGIWFFTQLSGLLSIGAYGAFGGIAWWAHIGGFLVGLLLVRIFVRKRRAVPIEIIKYP